MWLLASCSSTSEPATGDLHADLRSADPRIRILATRAAAQDQRLDLLDALTTTLRDTDPAVRMFADIALRKLTGRDFEYKPYGTIAEREEAQARWLHYLTESSTVGKRAEVEADAKSQQE